MGGDEFVLLLPPVAPPDGALAVGARRLAALAQDGDYGGQTVRVWASVGLALFDGAGATAAQVLATPAKPAWDFRVSESPDGKAIVFCRAETGGVPGIWIADGDGKNPRLLTRGWEDKGADHPRWLPA